MIISQSVIEALQASVKLHWRAIHVYTLQAAHFARWGYPKLAEKAKADAAEETEHLSKLTARLELANFAPECVLEGDCTIARHDFAGQLVLNLALENSAAEVERAGIYTACEAMDDGSAKVFRELLEGSEESIREIEAAQQVITEIGLENYLANQV
jgi:bacterioferritin